MLSDNLKTTGSQELLEFVKNVRGREYVGSRFNEFDRPERNKKYKGYSIRLKTSYAKQKPKNDPIDRLERLLLSGFGMNSIKFYDHQPEMLWSYPSAGACYPIELYVVINNAPPLEKGVFYYSPHDMALYKINNENIHLHDNLLEQDSDDDIYIVFTAALWKSCWKYSYRGYQFCHLDAGHVITNMRLLANTLGMDTSTYTICNNRSISKLLNLDAIEEAVGLISIKNFNQSREISNSKVVGKDHLSNSYTNDPDQSNQFNWEPISSFQKEVYAKNLIPKASWLSESRLGYENQNFDKLLNLIKYRRSASTFNKEKIALSDFDKIVEFISHCDFPLETTFVINNVNSLESGIYKLESGHLKKEKIGDFNVKVKELCINQEILENASVALFFSANLGMEDEDLHWKKSLIESGMLAQEIHLKVNEIGLGYSCIGGYYDEEVKEFLNLHPLDEILYAGVIGVDKTNGLKRDRYFLNR
ncbi:SagB family peptide dehydrogenase [Jeotgalibacillus proteolyticus]|nr:SagB family peptide dehydrogenase [Jeotgalibacillus proteolyticus]